MVTFIVIVIIAFVAFSLYATFKHNSDVKTANIEKGGMRNSYLVFKNHLENYYKMNIELDSGSTFSYSRVINDRNNNTAKLVIGIRLDLKSEPVLFTKFKSSSLGDIEGMNVVGVDFENRTSIDRCIDVSFNKIRNSGVIDYSKSIPEIFDLSKTERKPPFQSEKEITKAQCEDTLVSLINQNKVLKALLFVRSYIESYPEEKERLEKIKQTLHDKYYNSEEYLNSESPF